MGKPVDKPMAKGVTKTEDSSESKSKFEPKASQRKSGSGPKAKSISAPPANYKHVDQKYNQKIVDLTHFCNSIVASFTLSQNRKSI